MSGQAASYYNTNQAFPDSQPGPPPAQPVYGQDGSNNAYQKAGNPSEKTGFRPDYGQPVTDFNQAFRVEKPKFNDIWAGLLVS